MAENQNIIVRFPPSPTGLVHMGNVRTAIYNYLFARQNNGKFILRIEDTDKQRSKKEYEEDIISGLKWLKIEYNNKDNVWRQSERLPIYKQKMLELIDRGFAYISKEETGENREVVRFKNPCKTIKFKDLIRGEIEIDTSDLGDFIIGRNIDEPLYHLAVVVDDLESGITHIIRGEDHISNTPRQIIILEALGGIRPVYAHLPLILSEDKSKLSKRKHGEFVSLKHYTEKGYEAEAVLNFLTMIGWNPGNDQEIFSLEELVKIFDITKVQKKGGIFNVEKLNWINKEHIKKQLKDEKVQRLKDEIRKTKFKDNSKLENEEFVEKFLQIILDRIHRWGEVSEILESGEYDYLFEIPILDKEKIAWKTQNLDEAKKSLEKVLEVGLEKENIMSVAEAVGKGETLWPLRYCLSGREKSPDPFTIIDILGLEESKQRIQNVLKI